MHADLDSLVVGDRHEAHADGCVLVGPAWQIVSVIEDLVEPDRRVGSMCARWTVSRNPLLCRGRWITGGLPTR